jgi:hypothetical protein
MRGSLGGTKKAPHPELVAGRTVPIQKPSEIMVNFRDMRAEFSTLTTRSYGKQTPHSNPFRGGFFQL